MSKRLCRNTGRTWFKKDYIPYNKGQKGYKRPAWVGKKISKAKKRKKFYSPSQYVKGQKATKGAFKEGKLNPCWNGGGRLKYAEGFTFKLRKQVKIRDNNICQTCGNKSYLVIHHRDKKKDNHSLENLITLCASCHRKLHIYC